MATPQFLIIDNDDYIPPSCCFNDKKKRIHLVIAVYEENDPRLKVFLDNLKSKGVLVEQDTGVFKSKIKFIKLHLPDDKATVFSKTFQVDCYYERRQFWIQQKKIKWPKCRKLFKFSETPEIIASERNPLYQISTFDLNKAPPTITYSETIYVLYKLMNETYFGDRQFDFGIDRLFHKKIILSVYSLHEGQWKWTPDGNVTSRQMLAKYWSNSKMFYKQQPLNSVTRYFGTEISYFFGLVGFYIKMVTPLAVAGILCVVWGYLTLDSHENQASLDVCNSDIVLCPRCHQKSCQFKWLRDACFYMKLTYLVDNTGSLIYGLFVLFWATIFHRLWLRRKNTYSFLWNVDTDIDIAMRFEYEKKAKSKTISYFTELEEPHMPMREKICRLWISWTTLVILVLFIFVTIILSAMSRVWFELYFNEVENKQEVYVMEASRFNALVINSTGSAIVVLLITVLFRYLANLLTEFETPRTKTEFAYSYVIKLYVLEFANHYAALFYAAFVKGRLYTFPGDQRSDLLTYILITDHCSIAGCLNDLNINLLTRILVFIGKSLFRPWIKYLRRFFTRKSKRKPRKIPFNVLPQWEGDYYLENVSEKYIINKNLKIVMIHGYMTLFALVCPLAPLFILIYALIELRGEAKEYIKHYQRPILTKITSSTVWSDLFKLTAYVGVVTNACLLAFTTTFVEREFYRFTHNLSLHGFFNSTLSVFNASQFHANLTLPLARAKNPIPENLELCYYPGKRYPPGHRREYHRTEQFWIEFFYKFLVVIALEHVVLLVTAVLEVMSSPIPYEIKQRMRREWIEKKEGQKR